MPTEEDLEQMITESMDLERVQSGILALGIETMEKAVVKVENISGFSGV